MADSKTSMGQSDALSVSLGEDEDIRYWTERFGVTREHLEVAVAQAGSGPGAVQAFLHRSAH